MTSLLKEYTKSMSATFERAVAFLNVGPKVKSFLELNTDQICSEVKEKAIAVLKDALESEYRPYTLKHFLYDVLIKLRNDPLLEALKDLSGPNNESVPIHVVIAVLKNHGVGDLSNDDREAIEMHLAVKAYTKLVSGTPTRFPCCSSTTSLSHS
jgi:hypothetical protein